MYCFHQTPPALRVFVAIGEQEPDRTTGLPGKLSHPAQLILLVVEVAVHAERAGAGLGQRGADTEQLQIVGIARSHELAVRGLVRIRTGRGEAERAGAQRLDGELPHLRNVVCRRRFPADGAVTHHIDAHRQVRGLRRDVDDALAAHQRIHEIGKALPLPGQSCGQNGIRNFLHPFHQIHQGLAMMFFHRCETHAAISEQDGRHAMPA